MVHSQCLLWDQKNEVSGVSTVRVSPYCSLCVHANGINNAYTSAHQTAYVSFRSEVSTASNSIRTRYCDTFIDMKCSLLRSQSIGKGFRQRPRHICCSVSHHGADSSKDFSTPARATTSHVQQRTQHHSRRAALTAALLPVLGTAALPSNASVSSDLLKGTQNWVHIGQESFGLWVQQGIDGIMNSDETGITNLEGTTHKRRFGEDPARRCRAHLLSARFHLSFGLQQSRKSALIVLAVPRCCRWPSARC
jgi:hypothetical protein